jgi:hypothetical protein
MHLNVAWPSDLKAWDAREDLARHGEGPKRIRYPHPAVSSSSHFWLIISHGILQVCDQSGSRSRCAMSITRRIL